MSLACPAVATCPAEKHAVDAVKSCDLVEGTAAVCVGVEPEADEAPLEIPVASAPEEDPIQAKDLQVRGRYISQPHTADFVAEFCKTIICKYTQLCESLDNFSDYRFY